jgi:hypothetical protein
MSDLRIAGLEYLKTSYPLNAIKSNHISTRSARSMKVFLEVPPTLLVYWYYLITYEGTAIHTTEIPIKL